MTKTGALTKGWVKNNTTGEKKSFLFNPTSFSYSRSATYSETSAPGLPYPITQFVKGNSRVFSIDLFVHDIPYSGKSDDYMNFLGAFLTPETNVPNYTKPPEMTFCFGYFIRRCVLEDLNISITQWDSKLQPTITTFTLKLRQVGVI